MTDSSSATGTPGSANFREGCSGRALGCAQRFKTNLLQGTLDMLRTVALEPVRGFAIAKRIEQVSDDALKVEHGSLYPPLEEKHLLTTEWGATENNRSAKYYKLTREGHKQLAAEPDNWRRLSFGIERVLAKAEL